MFWTVVVILQIVQVLLQSQLWPTLGMLRANNNIVNKLTYSHLPIKSHVIEIFFMILNSNLCFHIIGITNFFIINY